MSSLWTPGGEHPVDQSEDTPAPSAETLVEDLGLEEREQVKAMAGEMAAVRIAWQPRLQAPDVPVYSAPNYHDSQR